MKTHGAKRVCLGLIFFLCVVRDLPAETRIGVKWSEVRGNPALRPEGCLGWNCAGVGDPALLINADGSITTWFTTMGIWQNAQGFFSDGPYFGKATGRVGGPLAYSPAAPVLSVGMAGSWDMYLETPTVRRNPDATLTMWYMGRPASEIHDTALGQMVSTDASGTQWIRPTTPIYVPAAGAWDSTLVCGPTVVRAPNGVWYLYYTGAGPAGVEGVGLLLSSDGVNWSRYGNGPVLPSQPGAWDSEIMEQSVIYFKGQFWMWYSAYRGPLQTTTPISIGLATSADGIKWTRYRDNPVINPGLQGSWNDLRVLAPDVVVQADGSLLMAAYGLSRTDTVSGLIGLWRSVP